MYEAPIRTQKSDIVFNKNVLFLKHKTDTPQFCCSSGRELGQWVNHRPSLVLGLVFVIVPDLFNLHGKIVVRKDHILALWKEGPRFFLGEQRLQYLPGHHLSAHRLQRTHSSRYCHCHNHLFQYTPTFKVQFPVPFLATRATTPAWQCLPGWQ